MPKMKTRRATAKRAKVKKGGKVRIKKSHLRHILTSKTTKSKRHKRGASYVSDADLGSILRQLPYGA